jgi:hypothetical protein
MADAVYTNLADKLSTGDLDWENADIRVMMLEGAGYTFDADHDFTDNISGSEASGTNYSRKALSGLAATRDDANNRVTLDASDVTWTALDAGTMTAAVVYLHVNDDTDSVPLAYFDTDFPQVSNGGDFTITWNAAGLVTLGGS